MITVLLKIGLNLVLGTEFATVNVCVCDLDYFSLGEIFNWIVYICYCNNVSLNISII